MMKEYIEQAEKDLLHTYNRFQIVLDRGEGVHLYDLEGKEYLEMRNARVAAIKETVMNKMRLFGSVGKA